MSKFETGSQPHFMSEGLAKALREIKWLGDLAKGKTPYKRQPGQLRKTRPDWVSDLMIGAAMAKRERRQIRNIRVARNLGL